MQVAHPAAQAWQLEVPAGLYCPSGQAPEGKTAHGTAHVLPRPSLPTKHFHAASPACADSQTLSQPKETHTTVNSITRHEIVAHHNRDYHKHSDPRKQMQARRFHYASAFQKGNCSCAAGVFMDPTKLEQNYTRKNGTRRARTILNDFSYHLCTEKTKYCVAKKKNIIHLTGHFAARKKRSSYRHLKIVAFFIVHFLKTRG